jgi:hypothetical protein
MTQASSAYCVTAVGTTSWPSGWQYCIMFAMFRICILFRRPTILPEGFRDFPHSLQANVGILLVSGQCQFLLIHSQMLIM